MNVPGAKISKVLHDFYSPIASKVGIGVKTLLDRFPNKKVTVMGWSKGGSITTLAAVNLARMFPGKIGSVTFGHARLGNKAYADYYSTVVKPSWRVVNNRDLGAKIPLRIQGFHHFARELWFDGSSNSTYKVCDRSGEDDNCSNSRVFPSFDDHTSYLGINAMDGSSAGCK